MFPCYVLRGLRTRDCMNVDKTIILHGKIIWCNDVNVWMIVLHKMVETQLHIRKYRVNRHGGRWGEYRPPLQRSVSTIQRGNCGDHFSHWGEIPTPQCEKWSPKVVFVYIENCPPFFIVKVTILTQDIIHIILDKHKKHVSRGRIPRIKWRNDIQIWYKRNKSFKSIQIFKIFSNKSIFNTWKGSYVLLPLSVVVMPFATDRFRGNLKIIV